MAENLFAPRKKTAKVPPTEAGDTQLERRGDQSGQDGYQLGRVKERLHGQKVAPKKHWLKVLPAIEELNNRVTFRRPVQKQERTPVALSSPKQTQSKQERTPVASSSPKQTQSTQERTPVASSSPKQTQSTQERTHVASSLPKQTQSTQERTSHKSQGSSPIEQPKPKSPQNQATSSLLPQNWTPYKAYNSPVKTPPNTRTPQLQASPAQSPKERTPYKSPISQDSYVSPVAAKHEDNVSSKQHWLKGLPAVEEYNNRMTLKRKLPPLPDTLTGKNVASKTELTNLEQALTIPKQNVLPQPQELLEETTTQPQHGQDADPDNIPPLQEAAMFTTDPFIGSDRVITLEETAFRQFVTDRDITLVMFYDKHCPLSLWSKAHFKEAAEMTMRPNHQYAAVDCSKDSYNKLCSTEGIPSVPFFKVYSRGHAVARVREPRTFQSDIMKKVVEKTPIRSRL